MHRELRAFTEAAKLTRTPHAGRPTTPVTVRYSDSTGVPTIPDNDPQRSGPRGIAVRFHLANHVHTNIVAHSTNGFPVRTGEEFLEFLRAAAAFGRGPARGARRLPRGHPQARRFVEAPKPIPTSFAQGGVLRRHLVPVHQRRGDQPSRALPHPAGRGDRIPLG